MDEGFARAGSSLVRSLARAVVAAVNAGMPGGGSDGGLSEALSSTFAAVRAEGGPVLPGGAYLVGERGLEVFRPVGVGSIEPLGEGGVSVTVNVQGAGASSGAVRRPPG